MKTEKPTTEDEHYAWGASNAKTWRGCQGSVNYAQREKNAGNIPEDNETEWAREGTIAHQYADDLLTGKIVEEDIPVTFWEHLQGYVMFAQELAATIGGGDCIVMNEQKVPYFYNTDRTGTLDYGVVAEDASEVAILDLKYGVGVYVTAEENDQGAIYATSLIRKLEADGYVFKDGAKVTIYIYQPRHHSFSGAPEAWEISYRDLMDLAIDIEASYEASKAASPDDLTPSEDACRFCDARVVCQARTMDMFDAVPEEANLLVPASQVDPQLPEISGLTDEARVAIFRHNKKIAKWMSDVMSDSLARIEQGGTIMGLKTIDGNQGNRTWGDNEADVEKLLRKIPAAKRYKPRRVLSPAQAEKVLSSEDKPLTKQSTKFKNRWDELIFRKAGTPSLALDSDPKPARITGTDQFDVVEEVGEDDCF
jgi:hypothetical protein